MKAIIFHSYKGGVGRTLALANLGYALSRMGKKVVLLDLDVDAPSLHTKFEQYSAFRGGYIEYLKQYYEPIQDRTRATTVVYEVMEASVKERSAALGRHTLNIAKNLKLIPAGNPSQPMYWWNLGSTWLHFLLSLTREEISRVENGYSIYNTVSRKFLEKEREVIEALFEDGGADYLIVDCRSPREYSSAALIFWADTIVSMFNASLDGLQGFANVHTFVRRGRSEAFLPGAKIQPKIIPVLCRVPEDFPEKKAEQLHRYMLDYWREIQDPFGPKLEPPEPFATLHEYRDLEQTERLLLHRRSVVREPPVSAILDLEALLSHDYAALFRRIFANERDTARGIRLRNAKIWNRVLGLAEDAVARERFFPMRRTGVMLNGNERNVALRADSILSWLASLKENKRVDLNERNVDGQKIAHDLNELFRTMGYDWGRGFGAEFIQAQHLTALLPNETPGLLATWCKFDGDAGFGQMTSVYDARKNCGKIIWKDSFLYTGRKKEPHLTYFACGYIAGVLEHLLPGKGTVTVTPAGSMSFAFSKAAITRKPRKGKGRRQPVKS